MTCPMGRHAAAANDASISDAAAQTLKLFISFESGWLERFVRCSLVIVLTGQRSLLPVTMPPVCSWVYSVAIDHIDPPPTIDTPHAEDGAGHAVSAIASDRTTPHGVLAVLEHERNVGVEETDRRSPRSFGPQS